MYVSRGRSIERSPRLHATRLGACCALAALLVVTGCVTTGARVPRQHALATGDSTTLLAPGGCPSVIGTSAGSSLQLGSESCRMHVRSLTDLLQGRIAGLDVARRADGGVTMRVRGANSAFGDEPLVVIDGDPLPGGPALAGFLSAINPDDVIRVQLLKDVSATAIYGPRGTNGVVLISLRHGH